MSCNVVREQARRRTEGLRAEELEEVGNTYSFGSRLLRLRLFGGGRAFSCETSSFVVDPTLESTGSFAALGLARFVGGSILLSRLDGMYVHRVSAPSSLSIQIRNNNPI